MIDITIHGVIGAAVTGADIHGQIKAAGSEDITLHLHSPGGSIFDASAIVTAIREHPGQVTAYIDGGAGSMAAVIALEADEIVMHPAGILMFHQPSNSGTLSEIEGALPLMQEFHLAQLTKLHVMTGLPLEELREKLSGDWLLTGREAARLGLATLLFATEMAACLEWDGFPVNAKGQQSRNILDPVAAPVTNECETSNDHEQKPLFLLFR